MAFWNRFFGSAGSQAVGVAIGTTAMPALLPAAQEIINEAWSLHPNRPPDVIVITQGVAQGQVDEGSARTWAHEQGFGDAQFDALVAVADTGPGVSLAFELWRRGRIDQSGFERAAKREGLEDEWVAALVQIKRILLSPAELANAVVQGHRSFAAALTDAELHGLTAADFQTMVDNTGLPPGPETGLDWLRRGILTEPEFDDLVLEGHTKPKYTAKYLEALHPVLHATDYAELHLRAWISEAEMNTGGALTGYTPEQMRLLYENRGRPATGHQILVGLRRGGTVGGSLAGIPQAFVDAIARSNIRPEYTNVLWHAATSYPSGFMIRGATQSGDITPAQAHALLYESGWNEKWIDVFVGSWTGTDTTGGKEQTKAELIDEFEGGFITESELRDHLTALGWQGAALDLEIHLADARRIKGWRDKGITALGKRYVATTMDQAAADGYLQELGVTDPDTRGRIIGVWNIEREFK